MLVSGITGAKTNKTLILILLFAAWMIGCFDRIALNISATTIAREMSLSSVQIGMIMSSFFLSYAVMQFFGGYIADRLGSKKVIVGAFVLWSIFTFATGFAWSFISLAAMRFLFGFGEGTFPSASSVTIAEVFEPRERARAKSIVISTNPLGQAFGAIILVALMTAVSWNNMYYILGAAGLVLSVVLWIFLQDSRKTESGNLQGSQAVPAVSIRQLLKIGMVWKLSLIVFGGGIVSWGLISWMPTYWQEIRNLSLSSMGIAMAIPPCGGFVSTLVSGWLLDKYMFGKEKLLIIVGTIVDATSVFLMFHAQSVVLAVVFMTMVYIATAMIHASVFTFPLKHMPRELIGSATGIVNLGLTIAGIVSPTIMGILISMFGGTYDVAFWFLIACVLLSFIIALTIKSNDLTIGRETKVS